MALKADRHELQTDISFFMDSTATRGGLVCISTAGSGSAMDQSGAVVEYAADASGKAPAGVLLNDMVNLDLTRQHINWHKDEVQKGGKVTVLKKGYVVTDSIYPGESPAAGGLAYVAHSGFISTGSKDSGDGREQIVGRFLSTKDEDGYVKVEINLPNNNLTHDS
jgi:hypothetical protein